MKRILNLATMRIGYALWIFFYPEADFYIVKEVST